MRPDRARRGHDAFTLIEILVVLGIIAILAATIIPNFVGFDAEARVTATKSNLESLRTRVNLFRAKEGRYPDALEELTTTFYSDVGVKKPYLKELPVEMISDSKGSRLALNQTSSETLTGDGGWAYLTDTADVVLNVTGPLGKRWGSFADDDPATW
jgi:general secretion pathway protein G